MAMWRCLFPTRAGWTPTGTFPASGFDRAALACRFLPRAPVPLQSPSITSSPCLPSPSPQVPVLKPMDLMVEVSPRRVFANGHTYHINSISVNSDCETYMSADDLRINLWHLAITDRSFSILSRCGLCRRPGRGGFHGGGGGWLSCERANAGASAFVQLLQ